MTDYTDRAEANLAILKDCARDLESHLGLAARSREGNPNSEPGPIYIPPGQHPAGIEQLRADYTASIVASYSTFIPGALSDLALREPAEMTKAERSAKEAVADLVARILAVTDYAAARALVATV